MTTGARLVTLALLMAAAGAACGREAGTLRGVPSSTSQFHYRRFRAPVGSLFHYLKTTDAGDQRVFVYVPAPDRVEVLELEPDTRRATFERAHLDWTTFSVDSLVSESLLADGSRRPDVTGWLNPSTNTFEVLRQGRQERFGVPQYPVHVFSLDFISLILTIPHLADPTADFTIGVLNWAREPDNGAAAIWDGTATVRLAGQEPCRGATCWIYEISGPALQYRTGNISVNRRTRFVSEIRIPAVHDPGWHDFRFALDSVSWMSREQWAAFVAEEVRKL